MSGPVNPSEPFIRRPVATSLLAAAILLSGLVAYTQLPVAPLPRVDFPTISVSAGLPGASPETMASAVAAPLERRLGRIAGVNEITSQSSLGATSLTLQFALERDVEAAARDVQAAINAATGDLPPNMPTRPRYQKVNPSDAPVLILSLTSETLTLAQVYDAATSVLAQKISQVSGVGQVFVGGGQQPAVRVQVDPVALAGTGLTLEDVRAALAAANVNQPKGNLDGPRQDWALATNDQLASAASFRPLVIAYKNGAPIRLGEVAQVVDGVENAQLAGWAGVAPAGGGAAALRPAIIVNVQRQPGANIIEVTDAIHKLLPQLRASMPQAIDVSVLADRTQTVRASVDDVRMTLVLTIGLVVGVIYFFLGSLRATVIPGVAVPLSLIGTFGVMKLWGFSLDNLSLMALTISTSSTRRVTTTTKIQPRETPSRRRPMRSRSLRLRSMRVHRSSGCSSAMVFPSPSSGACSTATSSSAPTACAPRVTSISLGALRNPCRTIACVRYAALTLPRTRSCSSLSLVVSAIFVASRLNRWTTPSHFSCSPRASLINLR